MTLHFIADLHLDPERPRIRGLFLNYLQGPARQAQALYILGDLFEVWADDEVSTPLYAQEIAALASLAASGVAIYFICGNRDFLCGKAFARAAGLHLLSEPWLIESGPHRALLLHGDILCTDDVEYQRFRRIVRMPWLQYLYRRLPARSKQAIARRIRGQTQQRTRLKPEDILDVNLHAVDACMAAYPQASLMIHGHTHRPADHPLDSGRQRLVLADWSEAQGEYLSLDPNGWSRHAVRLEA